MSAGSGCFTTAGAGANTATANANAGIFALGTKTINVSGNVNLTGGSASASGPGTTASAFAMLDPGSLDLTASNLNLTPNSGGMVSDGVVMSGGVVLSAFGAINLTLGGVPTPLSTYKGMPGVTAGESTLISQEPIIVSIADPVILNLTDLFGLPAGFLPPPPPPPPPVVSLLPPPPPPVFTEPLNIQAPLITAVDRSTDFSTINPPAILSEPGKKPDKLSKVCY